MMFDGKIKGDYAESLTNLLNFIIVSTHEIIFFFGGGERFVKCGRVCERRSLKGQRANLISI
jgi:hypothetical protein